MTDREQQQTGKEILQFFAQPISDFELPDPLIVHQSESLRIAIEVLQENRCGCVLVVDSNQKLIGILSERDVMLRICLSDVDLDANPVTAVMTRNPTVATVTQTIGATLNLMVSGGYRHVPVVDAGGKPLGLVSIRDVATALAEACPGALGKS